MRVNRSTARHTFRGEDGAELEVGYDNRGEPYRQGISLDLADGRTYASVFLEDWEARQLRDLLMTLYPPPAPAAAQKGDEP